MFAPNVASATLSMALDFVKKSTHFAIPMIQSMVTVFPATLDSIWYPSPALKENPRLLTSTARHGMGQYASNVLRARSSCLMEPASLQILFARPTTP